MITLVAVICYSHLSRGPGTCRGGCGCLHLFLLLLVTGKVRARVTVSLLARGGLERLGEHWALESGVWRTILYLSLKIGCLASFSFLICYILTVKLFQTQFYKILGVYQGLKPSNILFYRQKSWFLVQNPWLHAITQLKSRFSAIGKCNYGQYNPKFGEKLGQQIICGQMW